MSAPLSSLLKDKGHTIHSITSSATLADGIKMLNELGIGALLVIDEDKLHGIISERDIIRKLFKHHMDHNKVHIEELMTKNILTVPPTMTVQQAMKVVTEQRVRHLPVMEQGKLVGLISIGDLTKWVMLEQEGEISALTGYIQGGS